MPLTRKLILLRRINLDAQQKYQTQLIMTHRQKILANRHQTISIVKIQSPTSPISSKKSPILEMNTNERLSPALELSFDFSPQKVSPRKDFDGSKWSKFYKKEIRSHQKSIVKNPRIKLIQNTHKMIHGPRFSFDKYVLHSTNKLGISSQSFLQRQEQNKSVLNNSKYFSSLSQKSEDNNYASGSNDVRDQKKRKFSETKRIFKGITTRNDQSRIQKFSLQLQKFKKDVQNEQEFIQHNNVNFYQSLMNATQMCRSSFARPLNESLGGEYAKIERNKLSDAMRKKRTRDSQSRQKQRGWFPTNKLERSQPQVLTIQIKDRENQFRTSTTQKLSRTYKHYQSRQMPLSSFNLFKRPNTTLNTRYRKNSGIQPW